MLHRLHISNFTLIDQINIDFKKGFSIVTGQTGAGKSIILGALSLVLGKRAESDLLYDSSKKCVLEAEFTSNSKMVKAFLKMNDFDINESVILRRELLPNGKSRSFINDTPSTLKQLNQIGATVKTYSLKNAFPSALSQIELSYDQVTQIEEFTVTFQYDYWSNDNTL